MNTHPFTTVRPAFPAAIVVLLLICTGTLQSSFALTLEGLVIPYKEIEMGAPAEAIVQDVMVEEGEFADQGKVVAILYTEREQLEAQRAEVVMQQTAFEFEATERLREQNAVSEGDALEARINHEIAAIDAKRAKAILNEKTIKAPWDGQITRIFKKTGETITRAEPFLLMLDFSKVFVQIYAPSEYISILQEGDEVTVDIPLANIEKLRGVISFVDPVIDAGSGLFRVKILVDNENLVIKPGMTATVDFKMNTEAKK